ncbi:MAG: copper amine oxidase N-terminal domain-containing protein, partial [Tissierella sp.]|nr:copper amine oxidase N-terminal domain-containing protein [Tissierella sp.]
EALGLEVEWDNETKTISGTAEGKEIILKLDSKDAKVNGVNKTLDVPAKAINGRTLVPVRFIAESLDMNVVWNQETRTVIIEGINEIELNEGNLIGINKLALLSDDRFNQAISIGKKGIDYVTKYEKSNYSLDYIGGDADYLIENALIVTPFLEIARYVSLQSEDYKEISMDYIKHLLESLKGLISFDVILYGGSIDFPDTVHMVIRQGDIIIQPIKFYGDTVFAQRSRSWPNYPAYRAYLGVDFPSKEVDFNKQAELIIKTPSYEFIFNIDFSKYWDNATQSNSNIDDNQPLKITDNEIGTIEAGELTYEEKLNNVDKLGQLWKERSEIINEFAKISNLRNTHKLDNNEAFEKSMQFIIDMEFFIKKLDGLKIPYGMEKAYKIFYEQTQKYYKSMIVYVDIYKGVAGASQKSDRLTDEAQNMKKKLYDALDEYLLNY